MTNRASLAILLLVIMPTVTQAQSEFQGTFRCTLVDIVKAFEPDGRQGLRERAGPIFVPRRLRASRSTYLQAKEAD
jgi:hypothetical protein